MYYDNEQTFKNIKRKIRKSGLNSVDFSYVNVSTNFDGLLTELKNVITSKTKQHFVVGILNANNVIVIPRLIASIPQAPEAYDILCLEGDIKAYSPSQYDTIYWKSANVSASGHYILNAKSINKFISNFKTPCELSTKLNVYCITQYHYSFKQEHAGLVMPTTINKKFETAKKEHQTFLKSVGDVGKTMNFCLCELNERIGKSPDVSFVCVMTDAGLFFNTLNTFLRLGLTGKSELIVIDDTGSDKKIDRLIANVGNVKYINITPKSGEIEKYPLGYKLNLGVKYSEYDRICILSDTHVYNTVRLVKCINILSAETQAIISDYTGLFDKNTFVSCVSFVPDIHCMVFTKDFWKNFSFEETLDDSKSIICLWIVFRQNLVKFRPFIDFGFCINEKAMVCGCKYCNCEGTLETHKSSFDLRKLIHPSIEESVKIILN